MTGTRIEPGTYVIEIDEADAVDANDGELEIRNSDRLTPAYLPPFTSEIIAWLEADDAHRVELWWPGRGRWRGYWGPIDDWREMLARYGDQRQPGCRIPAVPSIRDAVRSVIALDDLTDDEIQALRDRLTARGES